LATIVKAINPYLTTLSSEWNITVSQLLFNIYDAKKGILPNSIVIMNNTDQDGALGYHFESNGSAYGKVFAKTIIDNGGVVLYKDSKTPTIAQCICHEVMEMIGNPTANKWYNDNNMTFWAGELCDPVESNVLLTTVGTDKVGLSDYVLPNWFNPDATKGPFNKMNTLKKPFTLDSNGYAIIIQNGSFQSIYGSLANEDTKKESVERLNEYKSKFKK